MTVTCNTDPLSQPERTNGSVSPAQTGNRNESNTELTCSHFIGIKTAPETIVMFTYCPECGEKL